jgi:hypothetical protein
MTSDEDAMAGVACRSPDTPVTKSLMPYTNKAIPITKPASCTPNVGEAVIKTDKATASPPAATLSAHEALPGTRRFSTRLTLSPDMMLATPLNRSAIVANHTTKVALAIGYAKIMLESIIINPPRPMWTRLGPLTNTPVTTAQYQTKAGLLQLQ